MAPHEPCILSLFVLLGLCRPIRPQQGKNLPKFVVFDQVFRASLPLLSSESWNKKKIWPLLKNWSTWTESRRRARRNRSTPKFKLQMPININHYLQNKEIVSINKNKWATGLKSIFQVLKMHLKGKLNIIMPNLCKIMTLDHPVAHKKIQISNIASTTSRAYI
jgi:hypothetical protein